MPYLAHSKNADGEVHLLSRHLQCVGELAARFAAQMNPAYAIIARWAGQLHDLGKYRDAFQEYLAGQRRGDTDTHHAVYGAALAAERSCETLAFAIAGHHAGLHDISELENLIHKPSYRASERLPEVVTRFEGELEVIPESFSQPDFVDTNSKTDLFVRMIFSALVDADFLDTEKHFLCGKERTAPTLNPAELLARLNDARAKKAQKALAEATTDEARELARLRNRIYEQCVEAGQLPPGFFNLTVPTGGGKTLAGMAFALAHAARHELRRIIVVIPYLSIIEQNADEYRRILDPNNEDIVIENHSAVVLPPQEEGAEIRSPLEYAAENWDAPVIVTTAVQFVESLFANRPSRCRKLHNIAGSVVLLDEAQTLPAHLLHPLLSAMRELRESYRVSFVFSTATQPAFRRAFSLRVGFKEGETEDLIKDPGHLYKRLQRVRYEFPQADEKRSWVEIAALMRAREQSLCIVNTRRHARDLWDELKRAAGDEEAQSIIHLSSALCAEHRFAIIGATENPQAGSIRQRLQTGLPCRVVSTQLVEAGVDLDFPLVFRALGPLDAIVQAAGRCNREGRLRDAAGKPMFGRVIVFNPADEGLPQGSYRTGTQTAASMLHGLEPDSLATDHELFAKYFSSLYAKLNEANIGDQIEKDRGDLKFRTVARAARVITDAGSPVIAPYGSALEIVQAIRDRAAQIGRPFIERKDFRRLQRYMVNVRVNDFDLLKQRGGLRKLFPQFPHYDPGIHLLDVGFYDPQLGLLINGRPPGDVI